jgi:hypothetical protein
MRKHSGGQPAPGPGGTAIRTCRHGAAGPSLGKAGVRLALRHLIFEEAGADLPTARHTVGGHGAATVQSMCAPGCSTFLKAKSRCTPHCSTFYFDEVEADLCSHGMALWVTTGSRNGAATAQSRCRPCCSPLIFEEAEAGLPRARHCGWPRGSHGAKHVCMPHGGTLFSMKRKHRHGAPSTTARPILPGQGSGRFQK